MRSQTEHIWTEKLLDGGYFRSLCGKIIHTRHTGPLFNPKKPTLYFQFRHPDCEKCLAICFPKKGKK